jgi:uncharacterized protein (DUF58 family)
VEFSDYRDYEPGDDLRHLDWRLYARSDRLCIKRYMQETNARFYVVCDTSGSMGYRGERAWGSKLEVAKVVAGAMTWFLLRQNDAAGMVSIRGGGGEEGRAEFIRPSQKPSQFGVMLRQLDGLRAAGGSVLQMLLRHTLRLAHRRSMILFFSDLLEPVGEVEREFKELRYDGHDVMVFQVLDRDEVEFPFGEAQVFEDLESGERRMVEPGQAQGEYLRRFERFMGGYAELFRALEIPHCVMRTDEDPWRGLAMFLMGRRGKS